MDWRRLIRIPESEYPRVVPGSGEVELLSLFSRVGMLTTLTVTFHWADSNN